MALGNRKGKKLRRVLVFILIGLIPLLVSCTLLNRNFKAKEINPIKIFQLDVIAGNPPWEKK